MTFVDIDLLRRELALGLWSGVGQMTGRGQISYVRCHTMAVVELLRAVRDELVPSDGQISAASLSAAHLRTFSNPGHWSVYVHQCHSLGCG